MVSTKQFHWDAKDRTLSAELSDLERPSFERVYPDACDVGLLVISHVTGAEIMFAVVDEKRDPDGDLLYYRLQPTRESVRKNPSCEGVKMILFND